MVLRTKTERCLLRGTKESLMPASFGENIRSATNDMYILRFFIDLFKKGGVALSSICWPSRSIEHEATEQTEPLGPGAAGGRPNYKTMETGASMLGLTDTYHSWWESKKAYDLCIMHVSIYLLLVVAGYSFLFESWPVTDSIYFAVVIFTTVGYGDLSPSNNPSRLYTVCLAFYGIVILGIFLGLIAHFFLDRQEESMEKRLQNARAKVIKQFSPQDSPMERRNREFNADLAAICITEGPIVMCLLVFVAPIAYLEGWDVVQGFYWMFITGSTVGFGDLGPTEVVTRCLCIVYIPIAVAVTGEFLGRVAGLIVERRNDQAELEFMHRAMTLGDLRRMDTDQNGKVSPDEFLIHMLVALQKVEQDDIDEIMDIFHRLDKSKTGCIDKEDLMMSSRFQYTISDLEESSSDD